MGGDGGSDESLEKCERMNLSFPGERMKRGGERLQGAVVQMMRNIYSRSASCRYYCFRACSPRRSQNLHHRLNIFFTREMSVELDGSSG